LVALEFTGNGIMTINHLRTLTEDSLDCLIEQIHRDNQGAGLFIPFASQQHIHAIGFWENRMHIIGAPYDVNDINELLAEMWSEFFIRKARYVAGEHMTDPPASITYSSVVSRDSVRIVFLLAALNDIDLLATDMEDAYLNALPHQKVYTTAGPEFGSEIQDRSLLIVRALYGLKSSGAVWRSHLANTLQSLGYTSCVADPDVWYCAAVKPDGFHYYEYVLVYVDDLLVLSHQGHKTMTALEEFYRL
jgi:hypothetical protein